MIEEYRATEVRLGERGYPVLVGAGLLEMLGDVLAEALPGATGCAVMTSRHIDRLYGETAMTSLERLNPLKLTVEDGEGAKTWENAGLLIGEFLKKGLDRKGVVVALGGGSVGDLAGFTASIYLRGVPVVQVPTTLLAMVDSGIGGKTAVNHSMGKNLIGSFHQPSVVVADPRLLLSLPIREVKSGLAEVVKHGVIADAELLSYVEDNMAELLGLDVDCLSHVIERCAAIKAAYVEADERDSKGVRAALNYGHTLGHAVERLTGLRHGEAVSIGMEYAAAIAVKQGLMKSREAEAQSNLLKGTGLPVKMPEIGNDELLRVMHRDKKAEDGSVMMVLPTGLGTKPLLRRVDERTLVESLEAVR
ncbi:3-dehydroquinate synthase [Candidatus Bathyarchaeota archaeon]|nr:3-dehydroquinate synthase [Candidatus Bathyarchaeota archaeon]